MWSHVVIQVLGGAEGALVACSTVNMNMKRSSRRSTFSLQMMPLADIYASG